MGSITRHMPAAYHAPSPISPDLDFLSNSKTKHENHESSSLHLPEILSPNAHRSVCVILLLLHAFSVHLHLVASRVKC